MIHWDIQETDCKRHEFINEDFVSTKHKLLIPKFKICLKCGYAFKDMKTLRRLVKQGELDKGILV